MDSEVQSDLREQARKRVQKRRDFTAHLVAYVVVNSMLIGLWAISGAGYFWPAWVLLALGRRAGAQRLGRVLPSADHRRGHRSRA